MRERDGKGLTGRRVDVRLCVDGGGSIWWFDTFDLNWFDKRTVGASGC